MLRALLLVLCCLPIRATVNVRECGAKGDGVTNDTASLNAAFRTGCAESEDVYIPAGTYPIATLAVLDGCAISFYGKGRSSVLKLIAAEGPVSWQFRGAPSQALSIKNLAMVGEHSEGAGIAIEQYQSVSLTNVLVQNFGTPGYVSGHRKPYDGLYIRNTENVVILDSEFSGNERYGVELQAVHHSTVMNCVMNWNGSLGGVSEQNFEGPLDGPVLALWLNNHLVGNGGGGIDVETDRKLPPAQGILQGNRVIDCGNDNWESGWALVIGMHSFGAITGNVVERFAARVSGDHYANAVVYGKNGGPISILNNSITGTKAHAITGDYGTFPVTISGNTLSDNTSGIFIYKSPHVQIVNNIVRNSAKSAVDVLWSANSTIAGNQFSGNRTNVQINGRQSTQH